MDVTVQLSQKNCTCEIFFESKIKTGTGPVNLFTVYPNCRRYFVCQVGWLLAHIVNINQKRMGDFLT